MTAIATSADVNLAFLRWLKNWINDNGLTQQQAAHMLGVSPGTLNHILKENRNASDQLKERMISNIGLSFTGALSPYIFNIIDDNNTNQVAMGAGSYGDLSDEEIIEARIRDAEELLDIAAYEATVGDRIPGTKNIPVRPVVVPNILKSNASEPIPLVKVPLFDAGAGEPSEFYEDWRKYDLADDADFIYVDEYQAKMGAFGIKVHGDSMAPTIEQGDIVVVMPTRHIENGKVVLACWPGTEADPGKKLVKRYKSDDRGNIILYSDNTAHEPIVLDRKMDRGVRLLRVVKLVKDL